MGAGPDAALDGWIGGWIGGVVRDWRLDVTPADLDGPLDDLIARIGEPAFAAVVLAIEARLPEPFPEDLLGQVETLGELLEFAAVKRSRLPQSPSDERRHEWTSKHHGGP